MIGKTFEASSLPVASAIGMIRERRSFGWTNFGFFVKKADMLRVVRRKA